MLQATPWGAIAGAAAQAVQAPPAGPSEAKSSGSIGTNLDNSGWNVTFGSNSSIDALRSQTAPSVATSGGLLEGGGVGGLGGMNMNTVLLLVGALVAVKMLKKRA
jgi:hypothetical protein